MDDSQIQLLARREQYIMKLILVGVSTFGIFVMLGFLFFIQIPSENKELLTNIGVMVATGWVGVLGYYFGSSIGSANKDDKPAKPVL